MCDSRPFFLQTGLQKCANYTYMSRVEDGLGCAHPLAEFFIISANRKKDFHTNRPPKN
jgi:hypothetical protein